VIGQATAHRRANAFAQAIEDAGMDNGVHDQDRSEPGGTDGRPHGAHAARGPAQRTAPGPAHGPDHAQGGRQGGHQAGHQGSHASHAADRHADPEQGALVALAAALAEQPRPAMDPAAKSVQRAQLVAAMEQAIADGSFHATGRVPEQRTESAPSGLRRLAPRSRLSRRLAVGGLAASVAAGAFGGVAAASTNALPGDSLYGLKRSMEDIKLDMAGSDTSRGKVYLDMAATRMQEARRLMDRGRGGPLDAESVAEVRKALSGMHQEASEGHRLLTEAYRKDGSLQPMEVLNSFSVDHRQSWSALRDKLPGQLTDVSEQVTSVFDAIDREVAPLPLPKKDDEGAKATHGSGGDDTGGTPSGASPSSRPSGTATPGGRAGSDDGSPTPSPTDSSPDSLIGGTGLLPTGPTVPTQPGTTPGETPDTPHSVVLPPLLPGLLPGLGLSSEEDKG